MLTAQSAPWFGFELHARVPATGFTPRPGVDGGLLLVRRRASPLVPDRELARYQRFVRAVFTGRGGSLDRIVARAGGMPAAVAGRALRTARLRRDLLPRDLDPTAWAALWAAVSPYWPGASPGGRRPRR